MSLQRIQQFAILLLGMVVSHCFAAPPTDSSLGKKYSNGNPRRTSASPNIILILADDLGWGDLGCQGQTRFRTPHIDRLAASGLRFTQAYAGNTVCAPSRCALMTGLHSGHGRVRSNTQVPLEPDDVTLAEVLKSGGYRCAGVGKWALGWEGTSGHPNRQGFEDWFGYLDQSHAHDYYPSFLWRNEIRFTNWRNSTGDRVEYAPDWFARFATNYVQVHEDHPFFLYVASTFPHANNELGLNGMEVPSQGSYASESWPAPEKCKAAMIERLDQLVGVIVQEVAKRHLTRQTLIVFSSDNGPHSESGVDAAFFKSSGPFRGIKRSLYEGGLRVPLIASWPGQIAPGTTNTRPVALWDLLPTFAEIAKTTVPKGLDGVSFAPALFGRDPLPRSSGLYWESHENGYAQAVRFDHWKAIRSEIKGPVELYDLSKDSGETQDLAAQNPLLVAQAIQRMADSADPWQTPKSLSIAPKQSWQSAKEAVPR